MENGHRLTPEEWEAEKKLKLSKRLLYILRYGAEKEGLRIYEGGERFKYMYICHVHFSEGTVYIEIEVLMKGGLSAGVSVSEHYVCIYVFIIYMCALIMKSNIMCMQVVTVFDNQLHFSPFPGYVTLDDLMTVPILKSAKVQDVLNLMVDSVGYQGTKRFEQKTENGVMFVRATYGRRMERVRPHADLSCVHGKSTVTVCVTVSNVNHIVIFGLKYSTYVPYSTCVTYST